MVWKVSILEFEVSLILVTTAFFFFFSFDLLTSTSETNTAQNSVSIKKKKKENCKQISSDHFYWKISFPFCINWINIHFYCRMLYTKANHTPATMTNKCGGCFHRINIKKKTGKLWFLFSNPEYRFPFDLN